jgi:hypothetical protein
MSLIQIEYHPSRRQLAIFGAVWLVVFGAFGTLALIRGSLPTAAVVWTAAVVVPAVGWVLPGFMRIAYLGTVFVTFPIGFVLSYLILGSVWFFLITPVGWLMRRLGHDPLARHFDVSAESYWVPREQVRDVRRYFRQY